MNGVICYYSGIVDSLQISARTELMAYKQEDKQNILKILQKRHKHANAEIRYRKSKEEAIEFLTQKF